MTLQTAAIAGLLAALAMFCGDMLLYFTREAFAMDGTLTPYIRIMRKLPAWRMRLGGLLGPVAAFGYCIGFFQIPLSATAAWQTPAHIAALICALGIIVGGAYHAQFAYFGLLGRIHDENGETMRIVTQNVTLLSRVSMLLLAVGVVMLAILIAAGQTIYPRWFVLLSPAVLYFLSFLWVRLPQPLRSVLFGGWSNLMFALYFLLALVLA